MFVFGVTFLFRLVFTIFVPLIDDEAYHWTWSQELDLSYFDHPGMIAWLEAISTSLLGDTYFAVRLPSFICYSVAVIFLWKLARDLFSERVAHVVTFLFLWSPFWGFGGYVASPEPPFVMFWVLAAWVFYQRYREDGIPWTAQKAWLVLGLLMGFGFNSKLIMSLLAPGFLLFVLLNPRGRKDLLSPWPWLGALIAAIMCYPIFAWNMFHDWPSFKYQFVERHRTEVFSLSRWFQFWSAQYLFYTPFLYILMLLGFLAGIQRWRSVKWLFLISLALPSLAIFYPQPLWAEYKPHWSGTAMIFLLIGSVAIYFEGLRVGKWAILKPESKIFRFGVLGFYLLMNVVIYTPFLGPWLPKVYRLIKPGAEWNTRWDLSNEFYGWEDLGEHLQVRMREIHALTGKRPFLSSDRYELTAQTYWGAKEKTYMLSRTRSHYTISQTSEVIAGLIGRDSLFVASEKYQTTPTQWGIFDSCSAEEFKTYRGSELSRIFTIYHCKNFQGIKLN
jgi:dolichol-phosphate mannosyltransferase